MKSPSIRHMVIFCLRHLPGSTEAEDFLAVGRERLSTIPVVRNFEVLRQISPKNDYDYGYSMEFDSRADYEAYNAHPNHVSYVRDRWEKEVSRFLEIDFVDLPE